MADAIILGCDPGLSSGGLVAVDAYTDRVLASTQLSPTAAQRRAAKHSAEQIISASADWGDPAFLSAVQLLPIWLRNFVIAFDEIVGEHGRPAVVVVESFVDLPSRARRTLRDRWKTPLTIGYLLPKLAQLGYTPENGTVVFQNPSVLGAYRSERSDLAERTKPYTDGVVAAGDAQLRSEHEISAFLHAFEFAGRYRDLSLRPVEAA